MTDYDNVRVNYDLLMIDYDMLAPFCVASYACMQCIACLGGLWHALTCKEVFEK